MRILESTKIGGLHLKNRIVVTPHTFWFDAYAEHVQSQRYAHYVERMAEGGAGLVSAQAVFVPPVGDRWPFPVGYLRDRIGELAERAHRHGAKLVVQSVHIGANLDPSIGNLPWEGQPLWGFSQVPSDVSLEQVHEMTGPEIEALVEGWGQVAEMIVDAGADGLELHGGHGYLLHQSMSPWMNRREDEWGEPLRFWKAVLERVRRGLGPNDRAVLGARLPSDELRAPQDGGRSREELQEIARELVATGTIDYVNPSEGSSAWHYPRSVGTFRRPHGDFLDSVRGIRTALGGAVPVIGVGRITSPEEAERALAEGVCDLVGMTRAHIADPDVVTKLTRGDGERIRPCVGANVCINRIMTGAHVMCFHNAEAGREFRTGAVTASPRPGRVLVVGAGPAGLKTAEIAARRGHEITVIDRRDRPGGRLSDITNATRAVELLGAIGWLERELETLKVELSLGVEVDREFVAQGRYDQIVLATGSTPAPSLIPTDGSVPVLATEEAMALVARGGLGTVVVHDVLGTDEATVVLEQVASVSREVHATTPLPVTGAFLGWTHLADHVQRLAASGVAIAERTDITGIRDGRVSMRDQLSGDENSYAAEAVVLAQPRLAETSLQRTLADLPGTQVYVVGDAEAPRSAWHAFLSAENLARTI